MTFALTPVDPDSKRVPPRDAGSSIGCVRTRIRCRHAAVGEVGPAP